MSVPALIVPVLNRPDLLRALLASIDYTVDQLVVIDNGGVVPADIEAIRLPHNIGVGAAWNLGMQVTPRAPWWLIVNSDITFGPGDLAALDEAVDPKAAAVYHLLGFAAFVLTFPAVCEVGVFDPNFSPAYNEDLDYSRRCELAGVPRIQTTFTGTHVGSATIHSDSVLREHNGRTHPANDAYYAAKWGGHKQGGETFTTPFNRGGHVGDWRLDPRRLRDQAWPRTK